MLTNVPHVRPPRQVLAQDSNAWASLSDERAKAEWRSFGDALAKLRALGKVGTYSRVNAATQTALADRRLVGLSAQEVQKVLPEAVVEGGDGLLSLKYQDVFVLGLRATQELAAAKEESAAELTEVKTELAALRAEHAAVREEHAAVREELAATKEKLAARDSAAELELAALKTKQAAQEEKQAAQDQKQAAQDELVAALVRKVAALSAA